MFKTEIMSTGNRENYIKLKHCSTHVPTGKGNIPNTLDVTASALQFVFKKGETKEFVAQACM